MPPEGEPAPDDALAALAATVAPTSDAPTPPVKLAGGSAHTQASPRGITGAEATIAAPLATTLPPLPEVSASLYRTDREIARGGMGRIVAAEDRRLGRPVALKELLDPFGEQLTRFQREALITARLQHPGIVPVYEAGRWPTGEPFFAMKLVQGRPLDQVFADARTLEARLALLPRVAAACDAIAYAHSQRIIHRDLKPGNVLIGDFGETVVIDWGLAKDLDAVDSPQSANRSPRAATRSPRSPRDLPNSASSTLTVAGAVMGTPAYMAPEQARGELLDQRADVFALGAMLYHLLAGVPPYAARTATDVVAAAALGKVVPLGERERRAPRELRAIVERAMAPEPSDRYPHAGELADELRRFLTGQLVAAHTYTKLQRVARFVRRHRAAVTIAAIATAGFAIGGTLAVGRIIDARDQAQHEDRIATTRKLAAERLVDYMFTHVRTQLTAIGRLDVLAGLGAEVRLYYATLSRIPGGMPAEDEIRMVEAIELIGQAEHTSGRPDQALATWREAYDKIARIIGTDTGPRTFRLRRMMAVLDYESGGIFQERGKIDDAIAAYASAKREFDRLHDEQPKARDLLLDAANTHDRLGDLLRTEGKIDEALDEYLEAKTERERASSQGNGQVTDELMALSTSHLKLGSIYQNRSPSTTALEEYKTALKLREAMLANKPDDAQLQERVLDVDDQLADLERQVGDEAGAIATYRRALPMTKALVERDPSNADWQRLRGNVLADLGFALLGVGELADGLAQIELAIELQKDLVARDPKSTRYRVDLSRSYTRAGDAHVYLGHPDDGIADYRRALDIRRELVAKDPRSVPFRRSLAWSYAKLGNAFGFAGDVPRATDADEEALEIRRQLVVESPTQSGFKDELASTEIALGKLIAPRDATRSAKLIAAGLAASRALVAADPINVAWRETLVQGLLAVAQAPGDPKLRGAALGEALAIAEDAVLRAPGDVHWPGSLAEIHGEFAALATAKHDPKTAAVEWKQVRDLLEPLARAGHLPAPRLPLLDRARTHR